MLDSILNHHFLGTGAMSSLIETVICTAFVLLLSLSIASFALAQSPRQTIPRVGKAPGLFGLAAAKRDFVDHGFTIINEGYQKVGNIPYQGQVECHDH
jgi:hypothetical protein